MNWYKKIIDRIRLRYYSNDSWHIHYTRQRGYLNGNYKIGERIEMVFGGAFSRMEIWKFEYVGKYKGKKVFKELP